MRLIGVPVADRPECLISLQTAFNLAKKLGADVEGYHIVQDKSASGKLSITSLLNADHDAKLWPEETLKQIKSNAISAKKVFVRVAEEEGYVVSKKNGVPNAPKAVYREKAGSIGKILPLLGPITDLMVVTRPATKKSNKASVIMLKSLMNTASPVLILPPKKQKSQEINCIAIAWDRGQTISTLVHSTVSLLKTATDVVLITEGNDHNYGASAKEMCRYLKAHGVNARTKKVVGNDTAQTILNAANEEKANILMSGAYTKGKARDLFFGSVTSTLLENASIPVLMMHI